MRLLLCMSLPWVPAHGGANKCNRRLLEALSARHEAHAVVPALGVPPRSTLPELRSHLSSQGIEVEEGADVDVFRLGGVEVEAVTAPGRLRSRLVDRIRELQPDWILVSSEDPSQSLLQAALDEAPERVIYLVHTPAFVPFGPQAFFPSATRARLVARARAVVTVSRATADYLRSHGGIEAKVLTFPVFDRPSCATEDAPPARDLPDPRRRLATLINPCRVKGLSLFLELARSMPDLPFGAVPSWGTTPSDLEALSALPNIEVLSATDRIDDIFDRTRVLLVPSLWHEAFGLVAVEAMQRGIPVLASDVGGLPEAKLGTEGVLPVRPIEGFTSRLDENLIPIAEVPAQDVVPWRHALSRLFDDSTHYLVQSEQSRDAAEALVASVDVAPWEAWLLSLRDHHFTPHSTKGAAFEPKVPAWQSAVSALSPQALALLAGELLMRRGSGSPRSPELLEPVVSFAQQRLWILHQLDPTTPVYNIPFGVRISGALQPEVLERALREIVRRHDVLRTTFALVAGELRPMVAPPERFTLPVSKLRGPGDLDERACGALRRAASRAFDLARDLPLHAELFALEENEWALTLVIHHIAFDGWSGAILARELSALYEAYCKGTRSPLPELLAGYGHIAARERHRLSQSALEEHLAYWRERLQGAPGGVSLPTDRPRPAVQSYRGRERTYAIEHQLATRMRALAREQGVTPFMAFFTGFAILLSRHSGRDDIVVGTPIAGRRGAAAEAVVGLFLNTLVLRLQVRRDASFRELLDDCREVCLGAFTHQDVPFERLVDELKPERDLSTTPLFDVMFVLQNAPEPELRLPGVGTRPIAAESDVSKFDLTFSVYEKGPSFGLWVQYATDLFDEATIQTMVQHYLRLLEAAALHPDEPIRRLEMLDTTERDLLLRAWNATKAAYPAERSVHALIEEQAGRTPGAIAVIADDQRLTFEQLDRRANQVAHLLKRLGARPEELIAICTERSAPMVVGALGCLKAGAAYLPLDPTYPAARLAYILKDSQARIIVAEPSTRDHLPDDGQKVILLDRTWQSLIEEEAGRLCARTEPESLAYVIYTSGSTGRPKGVEVTHRALVNLLHGMQHHIELRPDEELASVTSFSFDIAALELFLPLVFGGRVNIISTDAGRDPSALADKLRTSGVGQATPSTWRMLVESGWQGGLRVALTGGEALTPELAHRMLPLVENLYNAYGPTETTVYSTAARIVEVPARISIGSPIANTLVYVLDASLEPAPAGVPGEVWIGGHGVARGYRGRAALTAERFVPDPYSGAPNARMYRTGDIGRWLVNGTLELLGRIDHQVKIRGHRIELGEIEALLERYPTVREAVVVARQSSAQRELELVAYVSGMIPGPTAAELQGYLKAEVPRHMVPSSFVLLPEIPRTPNGKVDRARLPPPQAMAAPTPASERPRDPLEQKILAVWETLVDGPIGIHDDFFDVGGHSLHAVRLMATLEEAFGIHLPLAFIFQASTVAEMAEELRQQGVEAAPAAAAARRRAPRASALRVLMLTSEYPPDASGGLGTHVGELAPGLAAEGLRVDVVLAPLLHVERLTVRRGEQAPNLFVHAPDVLSPNRNRDALACGRAALAAAGDFDLVHCQEPHLLPAAMALRDQIGAPLVSSLHLLARPFARWFGSVLDPAWDILEERCATQSDALITVSRFMSSLLTDWYHAEAQRVHVVYNGFDPSIFAASRGDTAERARLRRQWSADDRRVIFYAGRLGVQKGIEALLESSSRLLARRDDVRIVIAGAAVQGYEANLDALKRRHAAHGDRIRFCGAVPRDELARLYQIADVAVVPSLYEPFGYAALEAMAAGVPLVATRTGGLVEIVEDNVSGLLVDVVEQAVGVRRVDVDGLTVALERALDDVALRTRLCQGGAEAVARFGCRSMVDATVAVYEAVLAASEAAGRS
jgi:amino acid adenylation domain-containing protein